MVATWHGTEAEAERLVRGILADCGLCRWLSRRRELCAHHRRLLSNEVALGLVLYGMRLAGEG